MNSESGYDFGTTDIVNPTGKSDRPDKHAAISPARRSRAGLAATRRLPLFLGTLALGVIVLAVYYPATRAPFIFDDSPTIVDNPSIRRLWPPFGSGETAGPLSSSKETAVHGRPLVALSFAVNYYFGGLDPSGYHLVNMVVHLLSTVLLWRIVARTMRLDCFQGKFDRSAEPLSFAAALVWALHPVNTESVVYVTQRTELMMGFFYLATFYLSIRYWATSHKMARAAYLLLAALACVSGMLCKEMMASAPAMVLLYERTFVSRSFYRAFNRSWPLYVGLSLTWIPVLALNCSGFRTPAAGFGMGVASHEWWFTQAKVLFLYLKLAVWPWPLVIHYEIPYLNTIAQAWPWLLAAVLLVFVAFVLFWRRSAAGFVAVWFFAVLSPTLLIPLVAETAAERRMYVPLAAIVPYLLVGAYVALQHAWQFIARRTPRQSKHGIPIVVFSIALIAVLIGLGHMVDRRLLAYQDELSLWRDAVAYQPHNPVVQQNLGIQLARAGRLEDAISHLQEAVRLDPDSYRAHYNLARSFEESGRREEAAAHYRATLKLRPEHSAAHYNLAGLLVGTGRTQEAVTHLRKAVAAEPDFAKAHANLGILLMMSHPGPEAIEHLETALRREKSAANYTNLAWAHSQVGRIDEAIALAEKALELAHEEGNAALAGQIKANLKLYRHRRAP